jgi:hypothetical protein
MKRRIRSSSGCSRRAAPRGALVGLAIGLGLLAAACSSDLFHDTKWQSRCDVEPDAAICPQGTGGAGGTSSTTAASSASSTAASSTAESSSSGGGSSSSSASSTAGASGSTSASTGP